MISVFWFRRDLRLEDNTALTAAVSNKENVLPIFIFDENINDELEIDDARISFIYKTLSDINTKLGIAGTSLLCLKGDPRLVWEDLLEKHNVKSVYLNKDYEPYARNRDAEIEKTLKSKGVELKTFKDQVIFEENEILKKDGTPYTIFTPYKNKWLQQFKPLEKEKSIQLDNFLPSNTPFPSLQELGFEKSKIEVIPHSLASIGNYENSRDIPCLDETSYLSPHLRFGTVSIRNIIKRLGSTDHVFLSELVWREFFMQILFHFPKVVHNNFKAKYDGVQWRNNEEEFEKWCKGETGYPFVDAGMRQLNKTGYMHNRVRMITAGFLCKHLLIDWRWGEAYFASKLLDYDLSANNGNWQWAAGTGCDAAPYFRIFNPSEQLKKFDRNLDYVKKWVPELLTGKYSKPMVEHKTARERCLKYYSVINSKS